VWADVIVLSEPLVDYDLSLLCRVEPLAPVVICGVDASSGYKDAVKNRDNVMGMMTPANISTAQNLARKSVRKKYKGC